MISPLTVDNSVVVDASEIVLSQEKGDTSCLAERWISFAGGALLNVFSDCTFFIRH